MCVVNTLRYAEIFSVSEINWYPDASVPTFIKYAIYHAFIFKNKMLCFCLIGINSSGFCFIIRFSSFNLTRKLTAFFFYIIHLKIITKKSPSCCNWSNSDFTNLLLWRTCWTFHTKIRMQWRTCFSSVLFIYMKATLAYLSKYCGIFIVCGGIIFLAFLSKPCP